MSKKPDIIPFINTDIKKSIYIQIYEQLKSKIMAGELPYKSQLPSIREMSKLMNVSLNSIKSAYQQLLLEGFIFNLERQGYFVEDIKQNHLVKEREKKSISDSQPQKKHMFNFDQSAIDTAHFPRNEWRKMLNLGFELDHMQYGDKRGEWDLRLEIAQYLNYSRGVKARPEQIVIGAGLQVLINQLASFFKERSIYFEDPGYAGARNVFLNHSYTVSILPGEAQNIKIDKLKKSEGALIYITPSHQFPSGVIMPIQMRLDLLEWANKNNSIIIEDDYDSEFRLQGNPIPAMQSLDKVGRVLYVGTFSKAFIPSVRMAYMVLPEMILTPFLLNNIWQQTVPRVIQLAMAHFMKEGHWDKHIRKMRTLYRRKHAILIDLLKKEFADKIDIFSMNSGLRLRISFNSLLTETELIKKASEQNIYMRPYELYYYKASPSKKRKQFLLGYGAIPEEKLEIAVKELKKAWYPSII